MIYTCKDCDFLFYREGGTEECPNCGKVHIYPAMGGKAQRLQELLDQGKELFGRMQFQTTE